MAALHGDLPDRVNYSMNEECLGVEGELAKVKIHLEVGCESFSIDHTAIRVDLCHTILTTAFTLLVAKRYCC